MVIGVGNEREGSFSFVTWATGRLMEPFMELRKWSRFRVDYEFSYKHVEFEMPGFTQRMSSRQLGEGL